MLFIQIDIQSHILVFKVRPTKMDKERDKQKKRVVVLAMDGSEESKSAMNWYAENLRKNDDDVVVVHSVHHTAHYTMGSVWAPIDAQAVVKAFEEESNMGAKTCSQIEEMLKQKEIEGRVIQTSGDPGHRIVSTADEVGADFIVVGSRGLGTIRRTVLGSVSDFIVHHSNVPVFICRH